MAIEFHPPALAVLLTRPHPEDAMSRRDGRLQSEGIDEAGTILDLYRRAQELQALDPTQTYTIFEDVCTNGLQ